MNSCALGTLWNDQNRWILIECLALLKAGNEFSIHLLLLLLMGVENERIEPANEIINSCEFMIVIYTTSILIAVVKCVL